MRRILLVLAVAALMAVMMVAPAMAVQPTGKCPPGTHPEGPTHACTANGRK